MNALTVVLSEIYSTVNFFNKIRLRLEQEHFCKWRFCGMMFSYRCFVSDALMFAFVFKLEETFPRIKRSVVFEVSGVFGAFMLTSSCWELISPWKFLNFKK